MIRLVDEKHRGLGGSAVAAILGLDEYRGPLDVWNDVTGRVPRTHEPPSEAARWGVLLEDRVAGEYARRSGRELVLDGRQRFSRDDRPWHVGRPDRLALAAGVVDPGWAKPWYQAALGLEVKTTSAENGALWGAHGSADVPDRVATQCHWYMSLFDMARWDVAVLIGGQDYRQYSLYRNPKVENLLLTRAEKWWHDHVEADVPPPHEPVPVDELALAMRGCKNRVLTEMPVETADLLLRLAAYKTAIKRVQADADQVRAELINHLIREDARGFRLAGLLFRAHEMPARVNHKLLAAHVLNEYGVDLKTRLELSLKFAGGSSVQYRFTDAGIDGSMGGEDDDDGGT